jgi:prepilin-type N-terminal cleavage/methylation domain-containing protein
MGMARWLTPQESATRASFKFSRRTRDFSSAKAVPRSSLAPSPKLRPRSPDAGFTLTELMVTVVIVGILASLATPYLLKDRKASLGAAFGSELVRELQRVRVQALAERLPIRAFIYRDRVELRSWVPGARPGDPSRAALTSDPLLRRIPAPPGVDVYDVLTTATPAPGGAVLTTSAAAQIDFNAQGQMQFVGQAPMTPAFVFIQNSNVQTNHPDAYVRVDIRSLTGYVALRTGWN